jgi:hypothetical protein
MSMNCMHCSKSLPKNYQSKKKYCSLSCSSIYGKARLKAFSQSRNREKYLLYDQNIKNCTHCGTLLNYSQRNNKFCSKSCSAQHNNIGRRPSESSNNGRRTPYIQRYNIDPKQCVQCQKIIDYDNRKKDFCSISCIKDYKSQTAKLIKCICAKTGEVFYSTTWRKYGSNAVYEELSLYRQACKFTFGIGDNFPNACLIKEHGWYHPVLNPDGISRDHKLSIADGFKLGIDPEIMKHPANCTIMLHKENQRKNKKSLIHLDQLLDLIEAWKV